MNREDGAPSESWGGMRLVRQCRDAAPRCRVVVMGTLTEAAVEHSRDGRAFVCRLDDGTGRITLIFTGRRSVAGLCSGVCCRVEGTAQARDGQLVVYNPDYEIVSDRM